MVGIAQKMFVPFVLLALGIYLWITRKKVKANDLDTSQARITKDQAKIYADQLHSAMTDFGTDEDLIIAIFKKLNHGDFALVHQAFGIRPYLWYGSAPDFLGYPYDLVDWLRKEMNGNTLIKTIVERHGFTW